MGHKNYFEVKGKTTDGKLVVGGAFKMYETRGMPLPVSFSLMNKQNMVPDPIGFYESAKKAGWTERTIFIRLEEAYLDGFNKQFWIEVKKRLQFYISEKV